MFLVGHNPGLADLAANLTKQMVGLSAGNIAVVEAKSWQDIWDENALLITKY